MGSFTREVLTLQIGHYANFVGTHWWNIQESTFNYESSSDQNTKEIDHDVLFREGKNLMGEITYTPRLVAVDLKGSLNTLKQDGVLYDVPPIQEDLQWPGDVTLHKVDTVPKNDFLQDLAREEELYADGPPGDEDLDEDKENEETRRIDTQPEVFGHKYYDLDESVNVWSDYLRIHLHPKSVNIINEYQHDSDYQNFDVFGYGEQLLQERRLRDEMEDSVHFFAEECDHLQGLHLLVDTYDGFGGFAAGIMNDLQDEFGNKSIATFSLAPTRFQRNKNLNIAHRIINSVLCYGRLIPPSSMFVPLSLADSQWRVSGSHAKLPFVNYKPDLHYHTSAVLASCLDTITAPYRLGRDPCQLSSMSSALTTGSRKLLSVQSTFPFPLHTSSTVIDTLMSFEGQLPWQPVTPHCDSSVLPYAQSVVLRGLPVDRLKGPMHQNSPRLLRDCSTIEETMKLFLSEAMPRTVSAVCAVDQACRVSTPYPHIFDRSLSAEGQIAEVERPYSQGVESVPNMTALQCSNSASGHLSALHQAAGRLDVKKYHKFQESGLEEVDYREFVNDIDSMVHLYSDSADCMP